MFKNCKIAGVRVNSDSYHSNKAPRGTPEYVMSPSSIKAFAGCPSRWKAGYEPPDSDAKQFGNLVDCLVLTPEQFDSRYAVMPSTYKDAKTGEEKPWNGNSNVCKEWLGEHDGLEIVSRDGLAEAQGAVRRLGEDETLTTFLGASQRQVHVTGEWHDKSGVIVPVQCLIDCVPKKDSEFQKCLGDLKTTRNAAQPAFSRWCYTASYHIQAAFDLALYTAATGEDRTDWVFLLVENYAPWETGRRLLGQDLLQIGTQTYEHALSKYARCLKSGVWAGYDLPEEFSIINAEPWMEFNAMENALEFDQTNPQPPPNDDLIP